MVSSLVRVAILVSLVAGAKFGDVIFEADVDELSSSGVTGKILFGVFSEKKGVLGEVYFKGLTPNLSKEKDCSSAKYACSLIFIAGKTCDKPESQDDLPSPYLALKYPFTDSKGTAKFQFLGSPTAAATNGKLAVVFDEAGKRVACGTVRAVEGQRTAAKLPSLSDSGVHGVVHIVATKDGRVVGFGASEGLEPSLRSEALGGTDCAALNGCGVHVHNGTGCADAAAQGDHFWLPTSAPDPWIPVIYKGTSAEGRGYYIFDVAAGTPDVAGRPFIVHDNAGARVACGVLKRPTAHDHKMLDSAVFVGDADFEVLGTEPCT